MSDDEKKIFDLQTQVIALKRRVQHFRDEARRCRSLIKALFKGLDTSGSLTEIHVDDEGLLQFVVCAPGLDEKSLAPALIALGERAGWLVKSSEVKTFGTGTESDDDGGGEP